MYNFTVNKYYPKIDYKQRNCLNVWIKTNIITGIYLKNI